MFASNTASHRPQTAGAVTGPPRWFVPALLALFGLRLLAALAVPYPVIYADELIYLRMAYGFATGEPFTLRGEFLNFPTVLYPLLIAPTQAISDPQLGFRLVQAFNAALLTLAAWPLYRLAVGWLTPTVAAGATLVGLVAPFTLYANLAMTESLFLLLVLTAVYLSVRVATAESWRSALGLAVVLGLAFFTKPHGMFVPAVAAGAIGLGWWLRRGEAGGQARLGMAAAMAGVWAARSGHPTLSKDGSRLATVSRSPGISRRLPRARLHRHGDVRTLREEALMDAGRTGASR